MALSLDTGDAALAIDRVLQQQTDIAIAPRPDKVPDGLHFIELATSSLVFIRPQLDCEVRAQTLAADLDWSHLPIIVSHLGLSRQRLFSWLAQQQVQPNVYAEVAGHEAIVAMVGLGLGVGLVPQIVLEQSPIREQIDIFATPTEIAPYRVSLCCLERRLQEPIIAAWCSHL